ncbi:MAG TPA: metallophosphoesterase [Candidatus Dormibacteraeota bacterium]|nr:metallophosphoesterase [Candidatus Dormibacteraeota bacterium]
MLALGGVIATIATPEVRRVVRLDKPEKSTRSSNLVCGNNCASFQHSDSLPEQPPQGTIRIAIGGDARDDRSGVVPWAFKEARKRGSKAFVFLGDLELTPSEDELFLRKLNDLGGLPFYPAMGNHEIETLGVLRRDDAKSRARVKTFKQHFVKVPVNFAPLEDVAAYSADLEGNVHFIALDNVSRRGEGFGAEQLNWLEADLKSASAAKKVILVGMHKGLAHNPVTTHAMDEDGAAAVKESDAALVLFQKYKVAAIFVSHSHMYAAYDQGGIEVRLTGGLGAPLVKGLPENEGGFHHFLLVDVPAGESKTPPLIEVVKFPGTPKVDTEDESKEVE